MAPGCGWCPGIAKAILETGRGRLFEFWRDVITARPSSFGALRPLHSVSGHCPLSGRLFVIKCGIYQAFVKTFMPHRCCVPRCKGNYATGPLVRVYGFPKDEDLRRKWLRAIHRDQFSPTKHSKVSSLHLYVYMYTRTRICMRLCCLQVFIMTAPSKIFG